MLYPVRTPVSIGNIEIELVSKRAHGWTVPPRTIYRQMEEKSSPLLLVGPGDRNRAAPHRAVQLRIGLGTVREVKHEQHITASVMG